VQLTSVRNAAYNEEKDIWVSADLQTQQYAVFWKTGGVMKKFLVMLLLSTVTAFGAGWDSVMQIKEGQKIEIKTRDGAKLQGTFISATAESIAIRHKSGEQSIERTNVLRVGVYEANRQVRRGILFASVGALAGLGMGTAVCPSCANEGARSAGMTVMGLGAVVGAMGGFVSSPFKTIYEVK
jgi:hypothetical protein